MKDEKFWEYLAFDRLPRRGLLTLAASSVESGRFRWFVTELFVNLQCRVVQKLCYVELVPQANSHQFKVWLCKTAFQVLQISPQAWSIRSTEKIGDTGNEQLKSHSSTCVSEREKRKDTSILAPRG